MKPNTKLRVVDSSGVTATGVFGIGQFSEDPELLAQAISYLVKTPTRFRMPKPLKLNPGRKQKKGSP